jgi:hypothetical protein
MTQELRKCPHQIRGGKCGYGEPLERRFLRTTGRFIMRFLSSFLPRLLAAGFLGDVTVNGVDSG